jgi:transposase
MTDDTPIRQVSRLEVISTGARRRWTLEEKQRIVAESYSGPRLVSSTARQNGLSASQLFTWRRLAREGRLAEADEATGFAPAVISRGPSSGSSTTVEERVDAVPSSSSQASPIGAPGRMEIVLKSGHRVIVDNGVDATMLARVLTVLERR